jgi:hypothetical protein
MSFSIFAQKDGSGRVTHRSSGELALAVARSMESDGWTDVRVRTGFRDGMTVEEFAAHLRARAERAAA